MLLCRRRNKTELWPYYPRHSIIVHPASCDQLTNKVNADEKNLEYDGIWLLTTTQAPSGRYGNLISWWMAAQTPEALRGDVLKG